MRRGRPLTRAELERMTSRRARRRQRRRRSRTGMREFTGAVSEGRSSSAELLDLLCVALLLSLTGEVASVFAGETVLVTLFFFSTMFLCVAAWRVGA